MCHGGGLVEWRYSSTNFETCLWMGVSGQTVCPGYFTARQNALVFIELEAGWVL